MNHFIEGFLLQASLIIALGAQTLFVLESSLKKQHGLLIALICSACDFILIAVGVAGAATVFIQIPSLKLIVGIFGVSFLGYYGIKKILESLSTKNPEHGKNPSTKNIKQVILLSLSFSLLNPHVYLDTVVLIGGYSAKFPSLYDRSIFGLGAASFSTLWFLGLSAFSAMLSRFLNNREAMKKISLIAGLILLALAWKLGADVYRWRYL